MQIKHALTGLCILAGLLLWGSAATAQLSYKTYKEFPAFKLKTMDGETFTTTSVLQKGKQTVVMYFSPTCHHCQQQTEDITGNMKQLRDVQFLFVTAYPPEDIRPFLDNYGISRFSNIRVGYDPDFNMGQFYELNSIPGIFIYGKDKQLKTHFDTNVRPEKLLQALRDNP